MSDPANPPNVGGPNQPAATFLFPPDAGDKYYYQYNYKDSVNISWVSWAANSSKTTMQLWYWAPNFKDNLWKPLGASQNVGVNGSQIWPLNSLANSGQGYFLGQWNLNFTRKDNAPTTGLTLSTHFNCSFDDDKAATTYGSSAKATASQASGSAPPTVPASATQSVMSVSVSSSSSSSDDDSNGLSGGAIAGITVGVIAAVGILACVAFFFIIRRRRKQVSASAIGGTNGYQPPGYPPQNGHAEQYAAAPKDPLPSAAPAAGPKATEVPADGPIQIPMSELPAEGTSVPGHQELPASPTLRQELPAETPPGR